MRANGEQSLRVAKGRRREAEGGEESGRIITAWKYDGGKKERGRMGERDGGSISSLPEWRRKPQDDGGEDLVRIYPSL